jgi:WD40 repeat protein
MVLATGSPQTCVAVSEKFKVILCGGKDRKIRVWNPLTGTQFTQFTCFTSTPVQILTPEAPRAEKENAGVDMLEGHDARVIGLQVIDKYACLISASTDKTIRLWDLTTYMPLVKLVDTYTHRPVH